MSLYRPSDFLTGVAHACLPLFTLPCIVHGRNIVSPINLQQHVAWSGREPQRIHSLAAPVDPNSDAILNFIGTSTPLHPDFGSGLYAGQSIGIPYVVVSGAPSVKVSFTAYGSESDPGPMPIPANAPIEGYPKPGNGDRHVLVLDRDNCWLYELYGAHALKNGNWDAASAAVWDLLNGEERPYTWTSADAAGLPIFTGLARYDEVASGAIHHALRFTLQNSRAAFTPPAGHWAANSTNPDAAPMGMRIRLKSSYDISGFPPQYNGEGEGNRKVMTCRDGVAPSLFASYDAPLARETRLAASLRELT